MPHSDDTELRIALAADLDGYFERLVRCYQDRLFAFALRVSGNVQDAEEIAQDAFVRAYRALAGYSSEQVQTLALRAWLYQITLNVFRNRVRGRKLQLVPLDEFGSGNNVELSDDERRRPETLFEHAERERELGAVVSALPERYRIPVVLRHIDGFGYEEMAALLDQPVGTVKSNVHRGVSMLRKSLAAQNAEGE
jgi:RNA polymerase sigma-70 factor (ECF subfamily)